MEIVVVVGLGNPGKNYEGTRHNVGFMSIDCLADRLGISIHEEKWHSLIGKGRLASKKVILVKPQTYMNNSGQAVREVLDFYKLDNQNLIVIQDDIDISLGTIRIKRSGSAGSHNGLKSIISYMAGEDFPRVKISIGRRPAKMDLANFVLSKFKTEEKDVLDDEIEAACDAVTAIIEKGIDYGMNEWNGWTSSKLPSKSPEEIKAEKEEENRRKAQDKFKSQAEMCGDK